MKNDFFRINTYKTSIFSTFLKASTNHFLSYFDLKFKNDYSYFGDPHWTKYDFLCSQQNIVADHQIWLINQQVFKITDYVYFSSFFCIAVVNSCAL